jgi:hypothetical protein
LEGLFNEIHAFWDPNPGQQNRFGGAFYGTTFNFTGFEQGGQHADL